MAPEAPSSSQENNILTQRLQALLQERVCYAVSIEEAHEIGSTWVRFFTLLARIERRQRQASTSSPPTSLSPAASSVMLKRDLSEP